MAFKTLANDLRRVIALADERLQLLTDPTPADDSALQRVEAILDYIDRQSQQRTDDKAADANCLDLSRARRPIQLDPEMEPIVEALETARHVTLRYDCAQCLDTGHVHRKNRNGVLLRTVERCTHGQPEIDVRWTPAMDARQRIGRALRDPPSPAAVDDLEQVGDALAEEALRQGHRDSRSITVPWNSRGDTRIIHPGDRLTDYARSTLHELRLDMRPGSHRDLIDRILNEEPLRPNRQERPIRGQTRPGERVNVDYIKIGNSSDEHGVEVIRPGDTINPRQRAALVRSKELIDSTEAQTRTRMGRSTITRAQVARRALIERILDSDPPF